MVGGSCRNGGRVEELALLSGGVIAASPDGSGPGWVCQFGPLGLASPRVDRAGSAAAPNPDKPDSPGRSEGSLIELELVPKKAKRKAKSFRPPTWGGLRADRSRQAANSDARRSPARPYDFRTAGIGAATPSRLHCRRRRCRPHFALAIPCNNCFRHCRTASRERVARRPEPIMPSEEARQEAVVPCLFAIASESA